MIKFQNILNQFNLLINKLIAGNELWRFIGSIVILLAGLLFLEILFRSLSKRIQISLEEKGVAADFWKFYSFLPPLRLAFTALLLRLSEMILLLPEELIQLLRGVEGLLLTMAFILLSFKIVGMLEHLRQALPPRFQEEFPDRTFSKLKSILRISILIIVASVFIHTYKAFLPEWLRQYPLWRYLTVLVLVTVILNIIRIIDKFLYGMIVSLKDVEEKLRQRLVLCSTIWPIRLLLVAIAVYTIKEILLLPKAADKMAEGAIGLLATLAVVIFVYRLLDVGVYELKKIAEKEENLFDQTFVQMVRVIARVLILLIGAIYIIQAITGKPMSALLAGLGIGGLAVALAAQDTLKNFFGSIVIMLDKPFSIGQRIVVENYDGVVEDIGFRSTRVRTLTGNLVAVPNEKMASASVENIGHRPSIRRSANITITYDTTPEKVEQAVAIIRKILENHEGMHPNFPPRVYFNEFNDTSLNIIMMYWYHPPNYWDYCNFTERVNLRIMRAFEAEGIEFAFPTSTTYLAQDNRRPLHISLTKE